jgi:hypothetical protein
MAEDLGTAIDSKSSASSATSGAEAGPQRAALQPPMAVG